MDKDKRKKRECFLSKNIIQQKSIKIIGLWGFWTNIDGTCTTTCEAGTQTRSRTCEMPGVDKCLELDGFTRSLEEQDDTAICDPGSCEGKTNDTKNLKWLKSSRAKNGQKYLKYHKWLELFFC